MFTLAGRVTLQQVVEQGFAEVQKEFFGQFKQVIDALLVAKQDRCLAALKGAGGPVYREGNDERQVRQWASSFCRRWRFGAPEMVEKFQAELPRVLAYLRFPKRWRHRLSTTNLAEGEGFFRPLRRYQGHFPGRGDAPHSEQILGCYILACKQAHA